MWKASYANVGPNVDKKKFLQFASQDRVAPWHLNRDKVMLMWLLSLVTRSDRVNARLLVLHISAQTSSPCTYQRVDNVHCMEAHRHVGASLLESKTKPLCLISIGRVDLKTDILRPGVAR